MGSPIPTRTSATSSWRLDYPSLAADVDGNQSFRAAYKCNLQVTMERWPKVGFHAKREHGERLPHG
jgi:hypothetical protein